MSDPAAGIAPEPGMEAALATLRGLLTSEETLEAWAVQHRLFALTHRRACIAATSGRFISLNRRLLGGYESADIRWQDLKETRISAGILAADLTLVAQTSADLNLGAEVNRVRPSPICARIRRRPCTASASSTTRCGARSGASASSRNCARNPAACKSAAQSGYAGADAAGAESEPARRLRQAREMLDAKLISDSEFESIKAKIVSGL